MNTLKRFVTDVKKYWHYSIYAAKADLKSEVANSYLNWVWWILEPLCMMLLYVFVFGYIFKATEKYFTIFVFIGISMWDFFNRGITNSVKNIKSNKAIISKVYIPKYILFIEKMMVHAFKMLISLGIVVVMMLICKVPITEKVLFAPIVLLDLFLVTFAIGVHLLHFGVFVTDLNNIVSIALKFVFYMTGIFYNIKERIPGALGEVLLKANPIAALLSAMRQCLIYGQRPSMRLLAVIFVGSVIIALWGVKRIYKYENSYAKVV